MARTIRSLPSNRWMASYLKAKGRVKRGGVRDGQPTHPSSSCRHHGGCAYCRQNRLFGNLKRQPLEVRDE